MLSTKLLDENNIKKISQSLKCLTNEHRLTIVLFLKNRKSASVGDISDHVRISFKATSKHLFYLVKSGILVRHYDGPFVMYSLSANLSELINNLVSIL